MAYYCRNVTHRSLLLLKPISSKLGLTTTRVGRFRITEYFEGHGSTNVGESVLKEQRCHSVPLAESAGSDQYIDQYESRARRRHPPTKGPIQVCPIDVHLLNYLNMQPPHRRNRKDRSYGFKADDGRMGFEVLVLYKCAYEMRSNVICYQLIVTLLSLCDCRTPFCFALPRLRIAATLAPCAARSITRTLAYSRL
jgi:hypothetical protein